MNQRKSDLGLLLVLLTLLLLPLSSVVAEELQKGDPDLVYVADDLSILEDYKQLEGAPGAETVFALAVRLKTSETLCFRGEWHPAIPGDAPGAKGRPLSSNHQSNVPLDRSASQPGKERNRAVYYQRINPASRSTGFFLAAGRSEPRRPASL